MSTYYKMCIFKSVMFFEVQKCVSAKLERDDV